MYGLHLKCLITIQKNSITKHRFILISWQISNTNIKECFLKYKNVLINIILILLKQMIRKLNSIVKISTNKEYLAFPDTLLQSLTTTPLTICLNKLKTDS